MNLQGRPGTANSEGRFAADLGSAWVTPELFIDRAR